MKTTSVVKAALIWHGSLMNKTLLDNFETYQKAIGLAAKTIKNRYSVMQPLGRQLQKDLTEATTKDLLEYLARDTIKPATKRVERAAMKAFYTWAQQENLIEENPVDTIPPVRVPRSQPRPFTRDQIEAMLASGAYKRTRAMILLGYYQGFRVSQIAAVEGAHIDLLGGTITTTAKGGKQRYLPLHPVIKNLANTMPAGYWFPSPRGGHIKPESVTDAITEAKRRAGITDPQLTPHSLRHSFGSDLVDAGVDIRIVQELMLHEDLSTTQVYTRVSDTRKRTGIETLQQIAVPSQAARAA